MDAAAMIDGASNGNVTRRNARAREAPSIRAASARRGSKFDQNPPTVRTTTATLKNTCAISMGATPLCQCRNESGPPGRSNARNAVATTTVGRTNGTVTNARNARRPGNS